ncbi:CcmD family protein [Fulvivirga sp.]|uniref:CcmD family protein n=1 Tax=Fulvivirga sp. TaxID=1931237 RepID=UPI0032EDC9E3
MKKLILIFFLTFSFNGMAQEKQKIEASDYTNNDVEMADALREDGKIYVLTGIILIILAGTIAYLVTIDRKVSRLEKQSKS